MLATGTREVVACLQSMDGENCSTSTSHISRQVTPQTITPEVHLNERHSVKNHVLDLC